jgi:F-box protein 21
MITQPVTETDLVSQYSVAQPLSVFRRMANNLIEVGRQQEVGCDGLLSLRNGLELTVILSPEYTDPRLLLSRVYIHLNINFERVAKMLREISEKDPSTTGIVMFLSQSVQTQMVAKERKQKKGNPPPKLRTRTTEVKFAVGMIMRHKKYNYRCIIYGWDTKCVASRDWVLQMGVKNLRNGEQQPFYNVLVADGSLRYAAQENLEIEKEGEPIEHPEIGKHFDHYSNHQYFPNEQKANEYPEDSGVRNSLLDSSHG